MAAKKYRRGEQPSTSSYRKRRGKKTGAPPGSVIFTGDKKLAHVAIEATDFNLDAVRSQTVNSLSDLAKQGDSIRWLQVKGLHDTALLQQIGDDYGIHPLVLEDIANPNQPPKFEDFGDYVFVVAKMLLFNDGKMELLFEHIGIILAPSLVITFQETDASFFNPLLRRLENPKSRMRKTGADYFFYSLLDLIVDYYFVALDTFADQFEQLEDKVIERPELSQVENIREMKRELIHFRKAVRYLKEVASLLLTENVDLITDTISLFLRDLYDHTLHVLDSIDTQRELLSGLMDAYLSQISNRMNEVMKVLTIIATIFIPLTFLAGIYGMNFDNMPELHYHWAYFALLGVMAAIFFLMLLFFKKKKWL